MRSPIAWYRSWRVLLKFRNALNASISFANSDDGDKIFRYQATLILFRRVIAYAERYTPDELPRFLPSLLRAMAGPIFLACSWDTGPFHLDPGRAQLPELIRYLEAAYELLQDEAATKIDPSERRSLEATVRLTFADAYVHQAEIADSGPELTVEQLGFAREQFKEVRSMLPHDDGQWLEATVGLASVHLRLYDDWRHIADLDRADELLTGLAGRTQEGFRLPSQAVLPLAAALRHRFELTGDHDKLRAAISVLRAASDGAYRHEVPDLAVQLGITLSMLGTAVDDLALLDEAIELLRDQTSRLHGQMVEATEWLAKALGARGILRGNDHDLVAAAKSLQHLMSSLESFGAGGSAEWVRYAQELAWLVDRRYHLSADPEDLAIAKAGYQAVLREEQAPLNLVMFAAARLGFIYLSEGEPQSAAEVFERALEIQQMLVGQQFHRAHMLHVIGREDPVAAGAAVAHAHCGRAERAAVIVEGSRARILAQALEQDRADLGRLAAEGHPELRDRYLEVTALLDRMMQTGADPEDLRGVRGEVTRVIEEIRQVPGWSAFFRPADLAEVQAAACEQPLVYLVPSNDTGIAIIVERDDVRALWLPDLTWPGLDAQTAILRSEYQHWAGATPPAAALARDRYEQAFADVCRWLGTAVMGPLLDAMADADRVTLIAGGQLGELPLHAALLPAADGQPATGQYALDRTLVSYAPNARSLIRAALLRDRLAPDTLLIIVDPDTPQHKRLPAAPAEASAVSHYFPADRSTSLAGPDATREAVLQALGGTAVLHAACHAISAPADPMESAIILSGGIRLTVKDLADRRVLAEGGGLRLAVLSACESAGIGQAVPDEVIGLPVALIEAGAAAVIASLVAVPDTSTALLMARFYQHWLADGMPTPDALRRAQRWLRDATNEEIFTLYPGLVSSDAIPDDELRRRMWERARPHRHLTRWAAFVHIGP